MSGLGLDLPPLALFVLFAGLAWVEWSRLPYVVTAARGACAAVLMASAIVTLRALLSR